MGIVSSLLNIGAFFLFGIAFLVFIFSFVASLGKKEQNKSLSRIALIIVIIAILAKLISFLLPNL